MPPKVLLLGWGYPPNITGGLDTAIAGLYEELAPRDDVEVELVLPAEFAPEDRPGIHGVPTGEGGIFTRVARLASAFSKRASDADIVHTNDWFGYEPGSRASVAHDVEWVTTFHSLSVDRNVTPPEREVRIEQRIANRADELVAVSEFTRGRIREEFDADARVIYNGFTRVEPTGRDLKAELDIDGEMLFFVGRHTDQKGISHLLYAMQKVQNTDATLVLGGSGHQTEHLKMFAELLGITDRVEFAGYIPEEKLGDYYAAADVFISPSRAEPFGLTITEALAAGAQVVATESGVRETLPEGCLVEVTTNSDSIAHGIDEALAREGPPEYEPRTWDEVAADLLAVYNSALA